MWEVGMGWKHPSNLVFSLHSVKKVKQVETEVSKEWESERIVAQLLQTAMDVDSFG